MVDDPFKASRANSARDELLLSIVYSLYRTIHEANRWPLILRQIQDLLPARAFSLSIHYIRLRRGNIAIHSGCFREDDLASYNRTWSLCDPWLNHEEHYGTTGITWIGDELVSQSRLAISDFYREWLQPQDLIHQCSSVLFRDKEHLVYLRAYRAAHQPPFKRYELYPLQRLLPHLRQTLELHNAITHGRGSPHKPIVQFVAELGTADSIREVQYQLRLNGLQSDETNAEKTSPPAIDIPQTSSSPSEASASSRDALGDHPPPEAAQPTEVAASTSPLVRLAQRTNTEEPALIKKAGGKHGRRWLPVVVNTADDPGDSGSPHTAYAGTTTESESDPNVTEQSDNEKQLKRLYGLTPSEAKIAELLASGTDLPKAAILLNIGLSTVRTHLQRIYGKTDTHHQSELVALLLAGPARLRVCYFRRTDEEDQDRSNRPSQQ
jgi:DNA-binding CsgD family transcriptional regulator